MYKEMRKPTEQIAQYAKEKGYSVMKLAREAGISYPRLYDALLNKERNRELRDYEFLKLCQVLQLDPRDFMEDREA